MDFTIRSDEGLPIRGTFSMPAGGARALVVIVHGFKGFKDWGFFPWLANDLCGRRFVACRFNMSRCGIGDDPQSFDRLDLFADDTYSTQLADLRAVLAHAQHAFPHLPTFLFGHSRGGGVALLGSSGVHDLAGVVTWSSIARVDRWDAATKAAWRRAGSIDVVNQRTRQVMKMSTAMLDDCESRGRELDVVAAAASLREPLLAIHGGRDESVPAEESRQLVEAARDASLLVIGSAGHTFNAVHPFASAPTELVYASEVTARFIAAYA